jgi:hypothetical protein
MNAVQKAISLIGLSIAALVALFPPWASVISGNGYPSVPYRWRFSAAPVVNQHVYHVDAQRLYTRMIVVLGATGVLFLAGGLWRIGGHHDDGA